MEMVMRQYPNDWVTDSIMYKRGVGGGSSGRTHSLTEDVQGTYIYTIGPYSKPVMTIKPGDQVVVRPVMRSKAPSRPSRTNRPSY